MKISDQQFGDLADSLNEDPGGFSVNPRTSKQPTSGIMVAQAGTEHKVGIPATGDDIKGYVAQHQDPLAGTNTHVGGWHPQGEPTGDLDVSKRFTQNNRPAAMQEMVSENQKAAYDIDADDDIPNVLRSTPADSPLANQPGHAEGLEAANKLFVTHTRRQMGKAPLPGMEPEEDTLPTRNKLPG